MVLRAAEPGSRGHKGHTWPARQQQQCAWPFYPEMHSPRCRRSDAKRHPQRAQQLGLTEFTPSSTAKAAQSHHWHVGGGDWKAYIFLACVFAAAILRGWERPGGSSQGNSVGD